MSISLPFGIKAGVWVGGTAWTMHSVWVYFKISCALALADRHHLGIVRHSGNVRTRVHISLLAELVPLLIGECICDVLRLVLEHMNSRCRVWQINIDFLLEAVFECFIELPRTVGCTKYQYALI